MKTFINAVKILPNRCAAALALTLAFALITAGCGKGRKIPGLDHFNVGVIQGKLYASFVATSLRWDQGLTVPLPNLRGATLTFGPDLVSSGTVFQFAVPVATLAFAGRPLPLSGLPDGRSIPDIDGGVLPRWDTKINGLVLSLYLSNDVFGLFVPLKLATPRGIKLPATVSMTITDDRGNRVGKAYAVASKSSSAVSGVLILLPITKNRTQPDPNSETESDDTQARLNSFPTLTVSPSLTIPKEEFLYAV